MPREIYNMEEDIVNKLIALREQKAKLKSFEKIEVVKQRCGKLGTYKYIVKSSREEKSTELFLISELHDENRIDILYNADGAFIALKDYSKNEIEISREIEMDKEQLRRDIDMGVERARMTANSSSGGKAGDGRDLASKEHEEEEKEPKKQEQQKKPKVQFEQKTLKNLKNEINMSGRIRIPLNQRINEYNLWDILNVEELLKGRLPEGVSENSFQNGYLTMIDTEELRSKDSDEQKEKRQTVAKETFAICNNNGDIIELDQDILEPQNLGSIEERREQEKNRLRFADGKEVEKPHTDMDLTRTSLWKIKGVTDRYPTVNEDWYLGVDFNRQNKENGSIPGTGKTKEISFVQMPIERGKSYSMDSHEARTRGSIEYKLEDSAEPPLNEKEREQMEQLRKRDSNEAINVRKAHVEELEQVVEKLVDKYGEDYRRDIEAQVESEHKKGKDAEEIEKTVKENMDEIEDEYFRHGRSRRT